MQPIREMRVVVRWTMAVLVLGAAAVHFAAMGEHAGVSWTHGLFFALTAWVQVVLACWLVLRPSRTAIVTTVLVNFAIVVVWVVSRTFGIAVGTDGARRKPSPSRTRSAPRWRSVRSAAGSCSSPTVSSDGACTPDSDGSRWPPPPSP
jgi:hypothetical protein